MTDSYLPDDAGSAESITSAYSRTSVPDADRASDTTGRGPDGTAKQEAAHLADSAASSAHEVAGTAADRAQSVAQTAKEQAKDTAAETKQQVRSLLETGREQVSNQAGVQQQRLAGGLRSLSSELSTMADSSKQQGPASYVTRQLADSSDRIGDWLEKREPTQVMDEVAGYARRHPVAFMGIAAGLGLLVGRVVRGAKDADSGGGSAADHGSGSPEPEATTPEWDSHVRTAQPAADAAVTGRTTTTGEPL